MVGVLDAFDADPSPLVEIKHRLRIDLHVSFLSQLIPLDQAPPLLLIRYRRFPRLVDIFLVVCFQLRDEMSDERTLVVPFLREGDGRVAAVELREEGRAAQPLPVARVARGFVVDEPFLEDLGSALPVDVAASSRQEACDGVPTEMVYPPFLAELAHQCIDPWEPRSPELPALEPCFRFLGVDDVFTCDESIRGIDLGGQVPGDEAHVGIVVRLGEGVAKGGLGAEIHVSEEKLANEVCWDCRGASLIGRFVDDFLDAMVQETDGE